MLDIITDKFESHINFSYSCLGRVVFRGYIRNLFVEGSVINLLRNLGFKKHSNGVLKQKVGSLNVQRLGLRRKIAFVFSLRTSLLFVYQVVFSDCLFEALLICPDQ